MGLRGKSAKAIRQLPMTYCGRKTHALVRPSRKPDPLSDGRSEGEFIKTWKGDVIGVPGEIRTHDPRIRNPVLYPAELRGPG